MSREKNIEHLLSSSWKHRQLGNYEKALEEVKLAESLCMKDDFAHLGRVYHIYMQFESDHEKYAEAISFCKQSIDFYKQSSIEDKIAHSTRHLADLQFQIGDFMNAESNYRKALNIYRAQNETQAGNLANALRAFGVLLNRVGNKDEALKVWKETKSLYELCQLIPGVEEADHQIKLLESSR